MVLFVVNVQDADGSVPFFWGNDAEGHLVLSDNTEMMKKGCAKSYGPFPKGKIFYSISLNLPIRKISMD